VTIEPVPGTLGQYYLTPGSVIGNVTIDDLSIIIRPKIPIDRVFFLVSYALDPKHWMKLQSAFGESDSLVEAVAISFAAHLRKAFQRGLLQGYQTEEDSLTTIRGRIHVGEQIRKRHGVAPPVEVVFDDFTEDILENRLLNAALRRLRRMRTRSAAVQRQLRHFDQALAPVADVHYQPLSLPEIRFTRLNEHYRPALQLARLILRSYSLELRHGSCLGSAFLLDMNKVFEAFVVVALREALGLSDRQLIHNAVGRPLFLDAADQVTLAPDLTWWQGGRCVFVGDAKYKRVNDAGIKHADLYQLLAYTIAAQVPYGLLIYAAGEGNPAMHDVTLAGKRLEVSVLDVSETPDVILSSVASLAESIVLQRTANATDAG
jgi:5-methylcytosine-specific restriction enzyme subunit McrC